MNQSDMSHDELLKNTSVTNVTKVQDIHYEKSTFEKIQKIAETKESTFYKAKRSVYNTHEDNGQRKFSGTASFRIKKRNEALDSKKITNKEVYSLGKKIFLENTEIVCTGTKDHCFIVIENENTHKKSFYTSFGVNDSENYWKEKINIQFSDTETYDFYEDITMLNSPSYRHKSMDKKVLKMVEGKICKIRNIDNRRNTGVILLNGYEFFPLDMNTDDDLIETQFYASIRNKILTGTLKSKELEEYISIVKNKFKKQINTTETELKYSEYLNKVLDDFKSNEKLFIDSNDKRINPLCIDNNMVKEEKIDCMDKQINAELLRKSLKSEESYETLTSHNSNYKNIEISNMKNFLGNKQSNKRIHDKGQEENFNKKRTTKEYELIEETISLSSETTPSISPNNLTINNIIDNDSKNSTYILNESDLSDMNSEDEREKCEINNLKLDEKETLMIYDNKNSLLQVEEIDITTTTKKINKECLEEVNIHDDKFLETQNKNEIQNDYIDDKESYKSDHREEKNLHQSKCELDVSSSSIIEPDISNMDPLENYNLVANYLKKTDDIAPSYNIPLIEKKSTYSDGNIQQINKPENVKMCTEISNNLDYYNFSEDDMPFVKDFDRNIANLSILCKESISNISSNIINDALNEYSKILKQNDFYSFNSYKDNQKPTKIVENYTSTQIITEDFYTTTVEKSTISKVSKDDEPFDNSNILNTFDNKSEKNKIVCEFEEKMNISNADVSHDNTNKNISNEHLIIAHDEKASHDSEERHNNDFKLSTNYYNQSNENASISSENSIYCGKIKDDSEYLYIDNDKFKIIEKTTVIKEYFKIKDSLKNIDQQNFISNRRNAKKLIESNNHIRSKSSDCYLEKASQKVNRLNKYQKNTEKCRSSTYFGDYKKNNIYDCDYKEGKVQCSKFPSIYRSSGSLLIVDNHLYKKSSSENVKIEESGKNVYGCYNFNSNIKPDSLQNLKNLEHLNFNEKNQSELSGSVINGKNTKEDFENNIIINDLYGENSHDNTKANTLCKSHQNMINKEKHFENDYQNDTLTTTKNNNVTSFHNKNKKNIYEYIEDGNFNKSKEYFPYALEEDEPIKSKDIVKMNKIVTSKRQMYDEMWSINKSNETVKEHSISTFKLPIDLKNEFDNTILKNIKEKAEQLKSTIEPRMEILNKPSLVPVQFDHWESESCFSDDLSNISYDVVFNNNSEKCQGNDSNFNKVSFNKETYKNINNFECENDSFTETNAQQKLNKKKEFDEICTNNYYSKNILSSDYQIKVQNAEKLNKLEKEKLNENKMIFECGMLPSMEEKESIVREQICHKNMNDCSSHAGTYINTKFDFDKNNKMNSSDITLENSHNSNIVERSVSDDNEISLVDIVKKVKEQNGIYKRYDTKRKMHQNREENIISQDSPSQKNFKSVFDNLRKISFNIENLEKKQSDKNIYSSEADSSEDFRNSPVFNKIQISNKNRFEDIRKDKFEKISTSTYQYSSSSSDFGEPLYHSSFKSPIKSSQIKFEKPIPLITQEIFNSIMTNTRDSSPSSISSENCNQLINIDENSVLHNWNPEKLISQLYKIDYEPRKESKRNHFINMEGHLEVPNTDTNIIPELEKSWKRRYFKTKEGRLTWYATHYADENPEGDILLSGTDIECDKNEGIFFIHGGMEHAKIKVRVPREPEGLFEKWRKALLSHSSSSILDSYVQPVAKKIPHSSEKIIILELGSCSIRGGILTKEPSLPQSFFPAIGVFKSDGSVVIGSDALKPENRHDGVLHQPIPNTDPSVEKYKINKTILKACIDKVINDLKIDPTKYKVLLSLPQNIPPALFGDILKLLLGPGYFNGASVTRQPSLILYSYDVTTGVVVDIGEKLNIVSVIDGYIVDNAVINLPYGALQIEDCLRTKLNETNEGFYSFQGPVEKMILRYLMEQSCFVSNNYENDVQNCKDSDSVEVDLMKFNPTSNMKTKFTLNSSRFIATEGLFKPKKWGIEGKGLHQLINEAIQLSPIDSRRTLYKNIYLSGGTSLLPNLAERLENEIMKLVPSTIHIQVHTSPWRYHAAYLGAQVLASSCTFDSNCISHDQVTEFVDQLKNATF
uniref:PH domain-containing protein n=1 Tax=Parastrongyloides trichosuri TaxID=131310 RepID=A0A0N5A0G8_PARTI